MRLLYILLMLLPFAAWSGEMDQDLNKKLISVVRDAEIEGILEKSAEFKKCKDDNKFDPTKLIDANKAKQLDECFKDMLSKKNEQELKKLAENLGLEGYGLIQSKNVKDITNYLSNKLHKSLTGIDLEEQDREKRLEAMKFKNQTWVDHKVYFELYSTQMVKNALFELSRFCFENLRIVGKDDENFTDHWAPPLPTLKDLKDDGEPKFKVSFASDKNTIYKGIKDTFTKSNTLNAKDMQAFFELCSGSINGLCKEYEKAKNGKGGPACITKSRLQEYRKALANSKKVMEDFDKDAQGGTAVALGANIYDRGNSNEQNSIDNLTNYTSVDMLEGGKDKADDLEEECSKDPASKKECEQFLAIGDSRQQAVHAADMDLRLKKQLAMATATKFKGKNDKLVEYLKENGHLELAERVENREEKLVVEEELEKIFEAKREATVFAINDKLKKRQLTEDELKNSGFDEKTLIKGNAQESQSERIRLAQVVMFHNIITSHIPLKKQNSDGTTEDAGRNVNTLKKELEGQEQAKIDGDLFAGLKDSVKTEGSTKGASIVGLEILDGILGASPKKKN